MDSSTLMLPHHLNVTKLLHAVVHYSSFRLLTFLKSSQQVDLTLTTKKKRCFVSNLIELSKIDVTFKLSFFPETKLSV